MITPETILDALKRWHISPGKEAGMQKAVQLALKDAGIEHEREFPMDADSRIDFMIPNPGALAVGIECKTNGSEGSVKRQLLRYALTGQFASLILVTTRSIWIPEGFAVTSTQWCPLHLHNVSWRNLP